MTEADATDAKVGSGFGHRNQHHSHGAMDSRSRLSLVLLLTAVYMIAGAYGGWLTGSLTLLADAGQMLTDVSALTLALMVIWFSARPATPKKTFGYVAGAVLHFHHAC